MCARTVSRPSTSFPSPVHAHHIVNDRRMQGFSTSSLTGAEISNIFRAYRGRLDMTYWKTEENNQVCMDAINVMNEITIEPNCDRTAVSSYVSLMREVYLHAVANLKGFSISDEERYSKMRQQWKQIEKHFLKIKPAMERCWDRGDEPGLVAIFLTLAVLYAQYKDVCDEEIIHACYEAAQRARSLGGERMPLEVQQYCSIIEDIFFLRRQRYRNGKSQFTCEKDDEDINADSLTKFRSSLTNAWDKRRALDGQTLLSEYGRITYKPKTIRKYQYNVNNDNGKKSSDLPSLIKSQEIDKQTNLHNNIADVHLLPSTYTEAMTITKSEKRNTYRSGKFIVHIQKISATNHVREQKIAANSKPRSAHSANGKCANDNKSLRKLTNSDIIETVNDTKVIVEGFAELRLSDEDDHQSKIIVPSGSRSLPFLQESFSTEWNTSKKSDNAILEKPEEKKKNKEISVDKIQNVKEEKKAKTEKKLSPEESQTSNKYVFDKVTNELPVTSKTSSLETTAAESITANDGSVETADSFEYIADNKWGEVKKDDINANSAMFDNDDLENQKNSGQPEKQDEEGTICIILEGISPTAVSTLEEKIEGSMIDQQINDSASVTDNLAMQKYVTLKRFAESENKQRNILDMQSAATDKEPSQSEAPPVNNIEAETVVHNKLEITACSTETNVEELYYDQTELKTNAMCLKFTKIDEDEQIDQNSGLVQTVEYQMEQNTPKKSGPVANGQHLDGHIRLNTSKTNTGKRYETHFDDGISKLKHCVLDELKSRSLSKINGSVAPINRNVTFSNSSAKSVKEITAKQGDSADDEETVTAETLQGKQATKKTGEQKKNFETTASRLDAATLQHQIKEMIPKLRHIVSKEIKNTIKSESETSKNEKEGNAPAAKILKESNEGTLNRALICPNLTNLNDGTAEAGSNDGRCLNLEENSEKLNDLETSTLLDFDAKLEFERRLGSKSSTTSDKQPPAFYRKVFVDETHATASSGPPTEPPPNFPVIVKNLDNKFQHEKGTNTQEPRLYKRKPLLMSDKPDFNFILENN